MIWILENKEWIFSGIGVFIIGLIITLFRKKSSKTVIQKQKSGNSSKNTQIGGNVEINKKTD